MVAFSDLTQVMQNARTDAKTLDEYVHGAADTQVTSRLGKRYWTLATLDNKLSLVKIKAEKTLADIDTLAQSATDSIAAKSISANATIDNKATQANSDIAAKVANANTAIDTKVASIDTRADSEIANLQSAINAAAAAGAGANGWTTALIEEDGLTQRAINKLNIRSVDSIADLSNLKNPYNGQIVFVKSYYANGNTGTHHRIYRLSKATVNNGTTCINGWELYFSGAKYISTAAVGLKTGQSCVKPIRDSIAFLNSMGGGTVNIEDGEYLLDAANLTVINSANNLYTNKRYWFSAADNITIQGTRKAVLKVEDNIINLDKDKLTPKGYQIFIDNYKTVNFTLKGFTIDCNGANNLLAAPSERTFEAAAHILYFYYSAHAEIDDMEFKNHSGSNPILFDAPTRHITIKECLFTEMGMSGVGNTHQTDHSTIYISSNYYHIHDNTFINSETVEPNVATALELHGNNGFVYANFIENFGVPFIQAATGYHSININIFGNTALNAKIALSLWASKNFDLIVNFNDNHITFKNTTKKTWVVYTLGTVVDSHTGYVRVVSRDNTFVGNGSTGFWNGGRTDLFTSVGNTYQNMGVDGIYLERSSNSKQTSFIVKDTFLDSSTQYLIKYWESGWGATPEEVALAENLSLSKDNITLDIDCTFVRHKAEMLVVDAVQLSTCNLKGTLNIKTDNKIARIYKGTENNPTFIFNIVTTELVDRLLSPTLTGKVTLLDGTYYEKFKGINYMMMRKYDWALGSQPISKDGDRIGDRVINTNPVDLSGWVCKAKSVDPSTQGTWRGYQ